MTARRSLLAAVALVCVAFATPAGAGNALSEAGKFVERLGETAITQLTPKDISDAERVKRMRALLNEAFDVPAVGKFVLGVYWRRATEKQRAEFLELYQTVVAHTYAGLFKQYSGEKFTVTKQRPVAGGAIVYGRLTQPTDKGRGVPQDYVQAYTWYTLAVSHFAPGSKRDLAIEARETIATLMTPAQIAEAEKLAREWKPKKEGR